MFVGVGVFMCVRCVRLFREMGKWDLGGIGNGLLNRLIVEMAFTFWLMGYWAISLIG